MMTVLTEWSSYVLTFLGFVAFTGRRGAHGTRPRARIQRVGIIVVSGGAFSAKDDVYDKHRAEVG